MPAFVLHDPPSLAEMIQYLESPRNADPGADPMPREHGHEYGPSATARFRVASVRMEPVKHSTRGPDGHIAWADVEQTTAKLLPVNAPRKEAHNFWGAGSMIEPSARTQPTVAMTSAADDGSITVRTLDATLAAILRFGAVVELTIAPASE